MVLKINSKNNSFFLFDVSISRLPLLEPIRGMLIPIFNAQMVRMDH